MRFLSIVLCTALLAVGCKSKPEEEEVPSHILSKEQMIAVMADIHLAESYGYMLRVEADVRSKVAGEEYAKVLKTHGLDMPTFLESYEWYMSHPAVFDLMYDEVITLVKEAEQYAPEHLNKEKVELDSITKIPEGAQPQKDN